MSFEATSELRSAYKTLNEPARLLGLSVSGWLTVLSAFAAGYGWLMFSPLPWRMNFTLAVVVLGAPAALLVLRDDSTIGPARLLAGVLRWRTRAALLLAPSPQRPVRRGAVRLDSSPLEPPELADPGELAWPVVSENGRGA
jgi:hypothetical protein